MRPAPSIPCPRPERKVPLAGDSGFARSSAETNRASERNHVVVAAVDEQDRRRLRRPRAARASVEMLAARPVRRNSRAARRAARARRSPTCSASIVPWLKPTRASFESSSRSVFSSASRNASRPGAALLTPAQRSFSSRIVRANHCRPPGAWTQGSGALRRDEGRIRHETLPLLGDGRSDRCRRRHSRAERRRAVSSCAISPRGAGRRSKPPCYCPLFGDPVCAPAWSVSSIAI